MTRVDENREAQRTAEQRRLEEQQKAKQREASEQFGKVVARQRENAEQAAGQESRRRDKQERVVETGRRSAAGAALLARRGIQAQSFTAALQRRGEASVEKSHVEAKTRREEINEDKIRRDERREVERQDSLHERDLVAAIAGDERHRRGSGWQGDGADSGMGAGGQAQPRRAAEGVKGARGSGAALVQVPPELVRELVDRVFAGVTPEGLSQFTIELKEGVLGGARLDVVARDGKIACTFHTLDKNVGRLLKASEGQLARAFAHKGLTLERLAVTDS